MAVKLCGAKWTPEVNWLLVLCDCGEWVEHRADRWIVRCRKCRRSASLGYLRDDYQRRHA